jgi:hypothetical protein
MKTTVVHCKKELFDVYVGRPGKWEIRFHIYRGQKPLSFVKTLVF